MTNNLSLNSPEKLTMTDLENSGFTPEDINPHVLAEVDSFNHLNQLKQEEIESQRVTLQSFRSLPPSQREAAIKDFAYPMLTQLIDAHQATCDHLEETRSDIEAIKIRECAKFASSHPLIRRFVCQGMPDYNNRMKNGVFTKDGYRIVDTAQPYPGQAIYRVICWPEHIKELTDFAKTPEAIKHGEDKAKEILAEAERSQKQAAVELAEFKKAVVAELKLVPDMDKLLK